MGMRDGMRRLGSRLESMAEAMDYDPTDDCLAQLRRLEARVRVLEEALSHPECAPVANGTRL
jgi:hypothetical protein